MAGELGTLETCSHAVQANRHELPDTYWSPPAIYQPLVSTNALGDHRLMGTIVFVAN